MQTAAEQTKGELVEDIVLNTTVDDKSINTNQCAGAGVDTSIPVVERTEVGRGKKRRADECAISSNEMTSLEEEMNEMLNITLGDE